MTRLTLHEAAVRSARAFLATLPHKPLKPRTVAVIDQTRAQIREDKNDADGLDMVMTFATVVVQATNDFMRATGLDYGVALTLCFQAMTRIYAEVLLDEERVTP